VTTAEPTARMAAWLEHAWLENYLARALSTEESAWFEAYVLDKADLLDMIEADTLLRDGMASQSTVQAGAAANVVALDPRNEHGVRGANLRQPYWALAASLAVGVGIGALTGIAQRSGSRDSDVVANPTRLVFDTMRGEAVAPHVEHAGSAAQYVLIEAAVPDGADDVVVLLQRHAPIALQPSRDGFVSVLLSRNVLAKAFGPAVLQYRLSGQVVRRTLEIPSLREDAQ
jgi:hypothetical protein